MDPAFCNATRLAKFVTTAGKLLLCPLVLKCLQQHFQNGSNVGDWCHAHIRPAPLWRLSEGDIVAVMALINAGSLSSTSAVVTHLASLEFRASLVVSFVSFLSLLLLFGFLFAFLLSAWGLFLLCFCFVFIAVVSIF